jgi:hypothetical protein
MAEQATLRTGEDRLLTALKHMECALELLDQAEASADIGAHLDLAICRLREALSPEETAGGF